MWLFNNLEIIYSYVEKWTAWTFYCFALPLGSTPALKHSPEKFFKTDLHVSVEMDIGVCMLYTNTHISKTSKSSCRWGGVCWITLDRSVPGDQDWIMNLPKQKMFLFFVQKNKAIYYANCSIQFVLPGRLQMSNQSVICSPITWIQSKLEQDILELICASGGCLHE